MRNEIKAPFFLTNVKKKGAFGLHKNLLFIVKQ